MVATGGPSPPSLESLLSIWPIANTFSQYLPVGDLITLARLNVTLRSVLHGFEIPEDPSVPEDSRIVRTELNIGHHATPYWQRLKDQSPFECSSDIHTKGPRPRPCRYCSRPICDACIVRSSFARGHEHTFQNRVRHLCKKCWSSGNSSRTQRFPLAAPSETTTTSSSSSSKRKWYDPEDSTRDYCVCTLKEHGLLCIECKDAQNWEAISSADTQCHGQDCTETLDEDDKDRRRICLWCDKALPRQIGGTTRYYWNQKLIEARARNAASRQADIEEYNRKRLKLMRMSRREMRGDDAVEGDPDADLPQFVRHLDTINYRSYMSQSAAPSGDAVYGSKRGYWRYSREFLLEMRRRCRRVPVPKQLDTSDNIEGGCLKFARTNSEKREDLKTLIEAIPRWSHRRLRLWCTLKAIILEHLLVERLSYGATQRIMHVEYGLDASVEQFHKVMCVWNAQDAVREHRRKSLDREAEEAGSGRAPTLPRWVRHARSRGTVLHAENSGGSRPGSPPEVPENGEPAGDYGLESLSGGSATNSRQAQPSNSDDKTTVAIEGGDGGESDLTDQLPSGLGTPEQDEAKSACQKSPDRQDSGESSLAQANAHKAYSSHSGDEITFAAAAGGSGGDGGGVEFTDHQLRPQPSILKQEVAEGSLRKERRRRDREGESSPDQADAHASSSSSSSSPPLSSSSSSQGAQARTVSVPEPSPDDNDQQQQQQHNDDGRMPSGGAARAAPVQVQEEEGGEGTFPDTSVEVAGAGEVGSLPHRAEDDGVEEDEQPPPYTPNGWVWS
ncbi:hypothetical protein AYL99_05792 [Fonsecaea erecta]|uniref:Clr5 domain-containing protein n=1 Tax=Fonsecaea erecta TaxID=1367422 RepID=A0A178ZLW3_9EURO|nr:hypothetical protein AYL99_05792 [Fonsecaea erecta]OAP60790.1 hypothetical protein AYL99_05792 [Fonsecaea erecta]